MRCASGFGCEAIGRRNRHGDTILPGRRGRCACKRNGSDLHGTFCPFDDPQKDQLNVCGDSRRTSLVRYNPNTIAG
jgi:hypothetical protein